MPEKYGRCKARGRTITHIYEPGKRMALCGIDISLHIVTGNKPTCAACKHVMNERIVALRAEADEAERFQKGDKT